MRLGALIAIFAVCLLTVLGCAQKSERPGAADPATDRLEPAPTPTDALVAPQATPIPMTTPEFTVAAEPTLALDLASEIPSGLFLRITNLPSESTIRTSTIPIVGITSSDAVVSVNGVLVGVDVSGEFSSTLTLQEGPNRVEVVASDFRGNKVSAVLSVIYVS